MMPPVFELLAASTAVTDLIGTDPVRAYLHGKAPQGVKVPYVTWFIVSGIPENQLDGVPFTDRFNVQIDCWADDETEVETLATAVRDSVEPSHYMTAFGPNSRDPETMRYRFPLSFTFWLDRP